jgi:hypothetical protein
LKKGRATDLRNRIVRSELYDEYGRTGRVSDNPYAFADLLECSPDAKSSVVRDKLEGLMSQTRLLDDEDLITFLARCAEANSEMLGT